MRPCARGRGWEYVRCQGQTRGDVDEARQRYLRSDVIGLVAPLSRPRGPASVLAHARPGSAGRGRAGPWDRPCAPGLPGGRRHSGRGWGMGMWQTPVWTSAEGAAGPPARPAHPCAMRMPPPVWAPRAGVRAKRARRHVKSRSAVLARIMVGPPQLRSTRWCARFAWPRTTYGRTTSSRCRAPPAHRHIQSKKSSRVLHGWAPCGSRAPPLRSTRRSGRGGRCGGGGGRGLGAGNQ